MDGLRNLLIFLPTTSIEYLPMVNGHLKVFYCNAFPWNQFLTKVVQYVLLQQYNYWISYHADQLNEGETERNLDLLGHILNGSDELVVSSEQVTDQSLLITWSRSWNSSRFLLGLSDFMYMHNTFTHLLLVATSSCTKFRTKQVGMLEICKLWIIFRF